MNHMIGTTDYSFDLPSSFCSVWDVFFMISTNPNRAQMGRLFAALVGLCIQGSNCPKYSLKDADPIGYGGLMQEWLQSQKFGPLDTLELGGKLFSFLSEHIAQKDEVEEAENF